MSDIRFDMAILTARTASLRAAGEAFTPQQLNAVDTQSTISAVENSITATETANQYHENVGEYLIVAAEQIEDIGERFFEIDRSAAEQWVTELM